MAIGGGCWRCAPFVSSNSFVVNRGSSNALIALVTERVDIVVRMGEPNQ